MTDFTKKDLQLIETAIATARFAIISQPFPKDMPTALRTDVTAFIVKKVDELDALQSVVREQIEQAELDESMAEARVEYDARKTPTVANYEDKMCTCGDLESQHIDGMELCVVPECGCKEFEAKE